MSSNTGLAAGRCLVGGILGAGWSQATDAVTHGLQDFDTWGSLTGVPHVSEATTLYVGNSLTTSSVTAYTASIASFTGHVIWSIPGFPSSDSSPTYQKLLAGNYDSNFQQVFAAIQAATPKATVRPFWELEGNWFGWGQLLRSSNGYSDSVFAEAWDHVYTIGTQTEGFTGTWDFNARLYNGWSPENIPMNPAHYDVHSVDQYSMGQLSSQTQQSAWTNNDLPVYNLMCTIAARDGKRIGFSEVATGFRQDGTSMGDDALWLSNVFGVAKTHDCAYFCYFDDNDPTGGGTNITNRFQMATPATLYQPSTFSTSSYFPNTAAVWQAQATSANLTYVPATQTVSPSTGIPGSSLRRTTRYIM